MSSAVDGKRLKGHGPGRNCQGCIGHQNYVRTRKKGGTGALSRKRNGSIRKNLGAKEENRIQLPIKGSDED